MLGAHLQEVLDHRASLLVQLVSRFLAVNIWRLEGVGDRGAVFVEFRWRDVNGDSGSGDLDGWLSSGALRQCIIVLGNTKSGVDNVVSGNMMNGA